jgi:hypothetical protein
MNEEQAGRVRRICLAFPEATEQEAWGEPTFRVRKKIFAMYAGAGNHHGRGEAALWCKAPLGVQEILIRAEPGTYFSPPYVGVRGWVGIRLRAVGDAELREHVVQSYAMVAPARLRALLDRPPPAPTP